MGGFNSRFTGRTSKNVGFRDGFRSGLEVKIGDQLDGLGVEYEHEGYKLTYTKPEKKHRYTPDFGPLNNGIIIESKGYFVTSDRAKHLLIKAQYPDLDLRFVFSRANQRISKKSRTTYGMWCEHKGFLYAQELIPQAWIEEPLEEKRITAAMVALGWGGPENYGSA